MSKPIDIMRGSTGDTSIKLARVFPDPSINGNGINKPKFDLWIAFEFRSGHLVNVEVLKSKGIGQHSDQCPASTIDAAIARQVIDGLAVHHSSVRDEFKFYGYDPTDTFYVEGAELLPLLDAQLSELKLEGGKQPAATSGSEKKNPDNPIAQATRSSRLEDIDSFLADLDLAIVQSTSLIREFRPTNRG